MKKAISKSRTFIKNKILLKVSFSKKFFKSINDIKQGFTNYNFILFEENNNSFVAILYQLIKTLQKKKVKKDNKKFTQYLSENESIILRHEPVIDNKFVKLYYIDLKNVKQIYRYIKEDDDLEISDNEYEL